MTLTVTIITGIICPIFLAILPRIAPVRPGRGCDDYVIELLTWYHVCAWRVLDFASGVVEVTPIAKLPESPAECVAWSPTHRAPWRAPPWAHVWENARRAANAVGCGPVLDGMLLPMR